MDIEAEKWTLKVDIGVKKWTFRKASDEKSTESSPASNFAYQQFFTTLEQTVEELAKCFLLEFGDNRELSFGRCKGKKSFNELYDGLKSIK